MNRVLIEDTHRHCACEQLGRAKRKMNGLDRRMCFQGAFKALALVGELVRGLQ